MPCVKAIYIVCEGEECPAIFHSDKIILHIYSLPDNGVLCSFINYKANTMNRKHFLVIILFVCAALGAQAQSTERQYLSGTGLGNTVTWQFRCSDGRNSGRWSKIEVPSQWELQGFGEYTYGRWYKKPGVKNPSMETGTYKRSFRVPRAWQGQSVRLWFDGVMTDTEVFVNGRSAGDVHRGGFYRFSYDISELLKYGASNQIEVHVRKHSDNKSVNAAERMADWWLFGGIYRPVWLEAKPAVHIERLAVDARADGTLTAEVHLQGATGEESLTAELAPVSSEPTSFSRTGDASPVRISGNASMQTLSAHWNGVRPWTPEAPNLYRLTVSLLDKDGRVIHSQDTRIGFRTIDFRPRDGLYLNGTKLVMKGINRHTFHPDGGRTTNKELSLQDVRLIKEMNMNAVRSHYPPDDHFLDACDSLGLLYIDELAGWQNAYDTPTGTKLVREMLTRDVNHPCIVIWSNGNEGGWNTALDSLFRTYDPQRRHVIHPWADFDELDTHHYPAYLTGVARFTNGYKVFMPAEFMHGMYDQGHGAGLEDFWARYTAHPLFAGGFMWAYSDEAVRRADRNGELDSEDYNAPDGILGPYREKEGSYYSVREVWSPLHVEPLMITPSFRGDFRVSNRYLFTNLKDCSMRWRVLRCPSPLQGEEAGEVISVADGGARAWRCVLDSGMVQLPALSPGETGYAHLSAPALFDGDILELEAYGADGASICTRTFPIHYAKDYLQREITSTGSSTSCKVEETADLITLQSPAVTVSFRKADATISSIIRNADGQLIPLKDGPLPVGMKMRLTTLAARTEGSDAILCARYLGAADSIVWRLTPAGLLSMDAVLLNRASGGGGFDDAFTDTEVLNLGLTFSYPEAECTGMRWMGRGPYRVWKNRIPGTNYGIWQKDYNNTITGENKSGRLVYPEFKGHHAHLYWATLQSRTAPFTVYAASDGIFFRVFSPEEPTGRQDGANTMPDFPAGDISFLLDIPGIRCFKPISQHGPQSQPGIIRIKKGDEGLRLNLMFDFK